MPQQPKQVWGLMLIPKEKPSQALPDVSRTVFFCRVGKGKAIEPLFHSSRELHNLISKHPWLQNQPLGEILYYVYPKRKLVELKTYYPFRKLQFPDRLKAEPGERAAEEMLKALEGKGIASQLERAAIRHLSKRYPYFAYREAANVSPKRGKQLEKRGVEKGQVMKLHDYWALLQRTTRAWKHRKREGKPQGRRGWIKRRRNPR